MIGKTLVLACIAFGIAVAQTCVQVPRLESSALPCGIATSGLQSPIAGNFGCRNAVVSSGVATTGLRSPVFGNFGYENNVLSSGCNTLTTSAVSSPVVAYDNNVLSSGYNTLTAPVVDYQNDVVSSVGATSEPTTPELPVIQVPTVVLPTVEEPPVTLSCPPIPAPAVINQKCICTKTVVKPQIYQRQVTIPRIQRYIKRTVTPIVENVVYKSRPVQPAQSVSSSVSSFGSTCDAVAARRSCNVC